MIKRQGLLCSVLYTKVLSKFCAKRKLSENIKINKKYFEKGIDKLKMFDIMKLQKTKEFTQKIKKRGTNHQEHKKNFII